MNDFSNHPIAADEDTAMRTAIRRDMLRANSTVAVVFGALLVLALGAGLAGLRATQNLHRAEEAEATSQERLASAYLAQARAIRIAAEPRRREAALNAISNAAVISRSMELRTEAIACLALSDLAQEGNLIATPRNIVVAEMDGNCRSFAYADDAGRVFVNNSAEGSWSAVETGHRAVALTFSPDGKFLASKSTRGVISVWDTRSKHDLLLPSLEAEMGVLFSADSRLILFSDASDDGRLALFDLMERRKMDTAVTVGLHIFRATRDLGQVAVSAGTNVNIIDFKTGANIMVLNHDVRVSGLAWTRDGRKLAASCDNGNIYLWDLARGGHRVLAGHSAHCTDMEFSPDGKLLVSSSQDGTTRLWDAALCQTIAMGAGVAHHFTPDGERVGFWQPWKGFGIWRVTASPGYTLYASVADAGPLFSLDLSTSGRWCVGTLNAGFRVWDLATGYDAYFPLTNVYCVRVAPDERSLLVGDRLGLAVWPLIVSSNGGFGLEPEQARKISLPDGAGARAVAVSANGNVAAVELTDRRLVVIDMAGSNPPVLIKDRWRTINFKGPASATGAGRFAISPDGRWVATGFSFGLDDIPRVWNAQTGSLAIKLPVRTSAVGFSADGHRLGLAGTEQYSIWSVGDWQREISFDRDEPAITHGVLAFATADGTMAVSHSRQIVQLREYPGGSVLADLVPPVPQTVNAVRAAADGSVLVTATANDRVEVWRLGVIRKELAALGLDWGPGTVPLAGPSRGQRSSLGLTLSLAAVLGGFLLAAGFTLLTLRRHRLAIKRLVVAEAMAAQRNRELDTAKAELMHSQKMKALGTLAAGIAHDFNNLLSVVRMSNKLIGREAPGNSEIQEHVSDIEQAVLQGKAVVGSMLGYASERESNGELVDVNVVVEEVVSLLSREFLHGIALTMELERVIPKVQIGRGPLEQILLNLLVNAAEAMQGEGQLKIMARAQLAAPAKPYVMRPAEADGFVELTVIDSGPGIAPELRDRVFEPFFTTKHFGAKAGTGLGLSLVYSMAQQAGAGLSVESEPGRGAAFTLVFPVKCSEPVRQTHSARKEVSP